MAIDREGSTFEVAVSLTSRTNSRPVGSLALAATLPRGDLDGIIRATKSWEVTGEVDKGEVGPGCSLNCAYCNQKTFDVSNDGVQLAGYIEVNDAGTSLNTRIMVGNKIERKVDPEIVVEELLGSPLYDRNGWLILENYNDPGMNWKQTVRLATLLTDAGHAGPMTLITKSGLPDIYARQLGELRNRGAKLIGIVSYPGLPEEIEPAPKKPRLETLRRLKENNIPTIVSLRPLIRGINLDQETIARVIDETHAFTDFYIAGGLFVFDDWTPQVFEELGYPLGSEYLNNGYEVAKVAPEELDKIVRQFILATGKECVVMPHTSCAIAGLTTLNYGVDTPDRLAHWVDHKQPGTRFGSHCEACPNEQRQVCQNVLEESPDRLLSAGRKVLLQLGHIESDIIVSQDFDGHLLVVGPVPLNFSELAFIRQVTGMYVNNLPTFEGLMYRAEEAFRDEYNTSIVERVVGAVMVGEEWHVFLDSVLHTKGNENVEKHIRTRARARIKVYNASSHDQREIANILSSHGMEPTSALDMSARIARTISDPQGWSQYRAVLSDALNVWEKRALASSSAQ